MTRSWWPSCSRDGADVRRQRRSRPGWTSQPDLSPKWWPRFVRLSAALPTTPTNKVLARTLVLEKFRSDLVGGDPIYVRARADDTYRLFTPDDEQALHRSFESSGRLRAWDL